MDWRITYLRIAELVAEHSKDQYTKVGAILVKDRRIISIGINGMPNGFDNNTRTNESTNLEVLHAESNALTKCIRSTESTENAILYVTLSPCLECAKLIIQCGIKEVWYSNICSSEKFHCKAGLSLLTRANITHGLIFIK